VRPSTDICLRWRFGAAALGDEVSPGRAAHPPLSRRGLRRRDHTLRSGGEAITLPGVHGGLSLATVLRRYGALGIEHILSGPDHLLFLLALVFLVRGWRQLALTITAFTAAHSLSLALSVLDVVRLPPTPVEALIAASIVPVAIEALRPPGAEPTLMGRAPGSPPSASA
jgi:hypothetical protein